MRRTGFSLIELTIGLVLLSLMASAASFYYEDHAAQARVAMARNMLAGYQHKVHANALKAPDYHFDDLAQALQERKAPMDPWGRPFLLLHPGGAHVAAATGFLPGAPEAALSAAGSACPRDLADPHYIVSGGPPDGEMGVVGGAFLMLDPDLRVVVKLGRPGGIDRTPDSSHDFSVGVHVLRLWDHGSVDGDRVQVSMDGTPVGAEVSLPGPPGVELSLPLGAGPNRLGIRSLNEGETSPNTGSASLGGRRIASWNAAEGTRVDVVLQGR